MTFTTYRIVPSGDYLRIECQECGERCEFIFRGFDPSIPLAEVVCPNHGSSGVWKIDGYDMVKSEKPRRAQIPPFDL